jgi:hypothetical protein
VVILNVKIQKVFTVLIKASLDPIVIKVSSILNETNIEKEIMGILTTPL